MKGKKVWLLAMALLCTGAIQAQEIQMPAILGNGMVLQQQTVAPLWGWGKAGDTVLVVGSWQSNDTVRTKVDPLGRWQTEIATTSAGGPYNLTLLNQYRGVELTIDTIWMGEVWLCSGQSNMEWRVEQGVMNGDIDRANADYEDLHIFRVPRQAATTAPPDVRASWQVPSPESVFKRSRIGY